MTKFVREELPKHPTLQKIVKALINNNMGPDYKYEVINYILRLLINFNRFFETK